MPKGRPEISLLSLTLVAVVVGVLFTALRPVLPWPPQPSADPSRECPGLAGGECEPAVDREMSPGVTGGDPGDFRTILPASQVCAAVGYLCAEVERTGELKILRWPEDTPLLRVWVPAPDGVSAGSAQELQRAVVRGVQVWDRHPFPLSISTRSVPDSADIVIHWVRSLGGNRLGRARMEWRRSGDRVEVTIPGLDLVTHLPTRPDLEISPESLRLVAAHEMGHALGLPHSDDPRDLMYPQNTAWRPTQRDYRTMEALYGMENGALIRK